MADRPKPSESPTSPTPAPSGGGAQKPARADRLAKALRENLLKRKAQDRARGDGGNK